MIGKISPQGSRGYVPLMTVIVTGNYESFAVCDIINNIGSGVEEAVNIETALYRQTGNKVM